MAPEVNLVKSQKMNMPNLSTLIQNLKDSFAIFNQSILFYPDAQKLDGMVGRDLDFSPVGLPEVPVL